ncbi:hypothetical protein [Aneurinibacillus terranovensis]
MLEIQLTEEEHKALMKSAEGVKRLLK